MWASGLAAPRSLCSTSPPTLPLQLPAPKRRIGVQKLPSLSLHQPSKNRQTVAPLQAQLLGDVALVNVDYISPSLWLGLAVAVSGLVLYSFKLQNARGTKDLDIVTASLLVLCGGILTVQGWRLDPILMLSEGVLACVGVYYIIQTVELRKQLMDNYEYDEDPRLSDSEFAEYYDDQRVPGELPSTSSTFYDSDRFYYPDDVPREDRGRSWQEPYPPQWSDERYWDAPSNREDGDRAAYRPDRDVASAQARGNNRDAYWDDDDLPPRAARSDGRGTIPGTGAPSVGSSYGVQQDVPDSSVPSDEWLQRKDRARGEAAQRSRRDEVSW